MRAAPRMSRTRLKADACPLRKVSLASRRSRLDRFFVTAPAAQQAELPANPARRRSVLPEPLDQMSDGIVPAVGMPVQHMGPDSGRGMIAMIPRHQR